MTGATGIGISGATGPTGIGAIGATGLVIIGDTGPDGSTGPTGFTGPEGSGEKGDPGPEGATGLTGAAANEAFIPTLTYTILSSQIDEAFTATLEIDPSEGRWLVEGIVDFSLTSSIETSNMDSLGAGITITLKDSDDKGLYDYTDYWYHIGSFYYSREIAIPIYYIYDGSSTTLKLHFSVTAAPQAQWSVLPKTVILTATVIPNTL